MKLHPIIRAFALPIAMVAGNLYGEDLFSDRIAPTLSAKCVTCHNDEDQKGGLSLQTRQSTLEGGDSGEVIFPGDPADSLLLDYIAGDAPEMPPEGDSLTADEVATIRDWIKSGAPWPEGRRLAPRDTWWSRQPLDRPEVPKLAAVDAHRVRTPIDAFIIDKLHENGLALSPEADARTLVRRLYFDLIGLPPSPEQMRLWVDRLNAPPGDNAQQNSSQVREASGLNDAAVRELVDTLLKSPRYGERWARHWLDVVHYADTHGYDKDKVRAHAWPYRDYVIRSLNEDKPYGRFVKEQLAGDVFYPGTPDGIVALGFIAAGPFDWVGHIEVRNRTMEKKRVRNLDRDDMVSQAMSTFVSTTAHCARCHDHKFDPIKQRDYYALQAVFAAVDRADRRFDWDPQVAARRLALQRQLDRLKRKKAELAHRVSQAAGPDLAALDKRLAELSATPEARKRAEYGYHSRIEREQDNVKWVQVDLGQTRDIDQVVVVGAHDSFAGIGAGFGFPVRYRIGISDDPQFKRDVTTALDHTDADVANPGITPQVVKLNGQRARYVRVTALKLAPRQNDYIFALAELRVLTPDGDNVARGAKVTAFDSIEAPVRWRKANLVDGHYNGQDVADELAKLQTRREALLRQSLDEGLRNELAGLDKAIESIRSELASLPAQAMVYAAATQFTGSGQFGATGGKPREIHLLHRGNEAAPDLDLGPIAPGALSTLQHLQHHFDLSAADSEGQRRAALAEWIVDRDNPLTWRSIVNRTWHYHFGRGLVDSPNDFGRMGVKPTHPELLDWLAVVFRDNGQSLKSLHRLICTSAVYRQKSAYNDKHAKIDGGNRLLWRQNRQKLEAEAVRDSVLAVAGKLDSRMGGPGFRAFGFKDDHSPHYKYHEYDPDDPASHRRSVYRFIVRSVPDPFMTTLDCADPSLNVAKRNETLTALQALALLNNRFMTRMAEHFAARIAAEAESTDARVAAAFRLALARPPSDSELAAITKVAEQDGLANACRLIFNLNEFVFID